MTEIPKIEIVWLNRANEIPLSLWDTCFPAPLEGFWWYDALDRCGIEDQFTFAYALIQRDNVPVGIAPTFIMDVPMNIVAPDVVARVCDALSVISSRFKYQRTLFVGSPCSDEGAVGLIPGESIGDIIPFLQDQLCARARRVRASMIVWKDLSGKIVKEAGPHLLNCGLFHLISYPGSIVKFRGTKFDDYIQTLRSGQRNKLKKKLRLSHKMGVLTESIIQFPDDGVLKEIFALFFQTYEHGKTKFERLNYEFFKRISSHPISYFIILRNPENDTIVAFMLCFLLGERVINKFIGIDYSYKGEWFIYFRLWEAAVKWSLRMGALELQSGQTGYQAKYDLGHKLVPLTNYCRHLNPLINIIFKTVARYISWSTLDDDLANLERRFGKNED